MTASDPLLLSPSPVKYVFREKHRLPCERKDQQFCDIWGNRGLIGGWRTTRIEFGLGTTLSTSCLGSESPALLPPRSLIPPLPWFFVYDMAVTIRPKRLHIGPPLDN